MPKLKKKTRQAIFEEFMLSKANFSAETQKYYRFEVGHFLSSVNKYIENIQPDDIDRYISGLKRSTGGKECTYKAIWAFWSWATKRGYVRVNFFKQKLVSRPRLGKRIFPFHTREDLNKLLSTAPNLRTKALIALLADSGARISEILGITIQQIDYTKRQILIRGKGDKDRFIQFGPSTESFLKQYLSSFNPNNHVNIWQVRYRWNLERILRLVELETGIKCNPHSFRRSFAITLRQRNISPLAIMDLGGWEDIDMVLHYTRGYDPKDSKQFYKPLVYDAEVDDSN